MKFLSEKDNKVYNTIEELKEAEKAYDAKKAKEDAKKAARAERAKEVQEAFAKVDEDKKKANEILQKFVEDYGSYYTTISKPIALTSVADLLNDFLDFDWF